MTNETFARIKIGALLAGEDGNVFDEDYVGSKNYFAGDKAISSLASGDWLLACARRCRPSYLRKLLVLIKQNLRFGLVLVEGNPTLSNGSCRSRSGLWQGLIDGINSRGLLDAAASANAAGVQVPRIGGQVDLESAGRRYWKGEGQLRCTPFTSVWRLT